jgi:hypothetical protein
MIRAVVLTAALAVGVVVPAELLLDARAGLRPDAPAREARSVSPSAHDAADPEGSAPLQRVVPAERARSQVVPERPRALSLPSGTRVTVRAVGTARDGRLAVPPGVDTAAWWRGGARIGDPFGSVLVAAHVDSLTEGLGPFAELLQVRAGAIVTVTSRGLTQRYRVETFRVVPQGDLSRQSWIYDAAGPHRLTLVTCAPPYERSRGGYQNLAIVVATPVGRASRTDS